jgi:hypothetical protein
VAAGTGKSFCTECGAQVGDGVKFCAACGHPVSPPDAPAPPLEAPQVVAVPVVQQPPVTSKSSKPRWRKKRYWIPAAVLILLIIIGVTSGGKKQPAAPSAATTPATTPTTTTAAKTKPVAPSVPKDVKEARTYITKHTYDIGIVQATVQTVQIDIGHNAKNPSQQTVNELAQTAQNAHDILDSVRNHLTGSDGGSLGEPELEVFAAGNDLKNSMGALVAYTGNPNPETLAHFTIQYQRAIGEWNEGIKAIWHTARRTKPPVL